VFGIQSARKVVSITAPGGLTDGVSIANLVLFAFLIGSIGCPKGFLSGTATTSTSGTNAQHSTPNPTPTQSPSMSPAPNPSPATAPGPSQTLAPNQPPNPPPASSFFVAPPPLGDDSNSGSDAAPFATLERARQAVRAINKSMSSDINVYLHGGKYELARTIHFDQDDSGTNGFHVIYRAYPGEVPIINGGRSIVGWTPTENGIFKASAQNLQFRQLYVNGVRAERARTPSPGNYFRLQSWDENSRTVMIEKDKISNWANLNQVEMHVLMSWTIDVFRIASHSISGDYAIIVPMEPERTQMFDGNGYFLRKPNEPYYFENAMEFLVSPGQWYLNSNTNEVFYKPKPGEDMASAEVIAPSVEVLVSIQGTLDSPVRNLQFYGLTFAHSSWSLPSSQGFIAIGASVYNWIPLGGLPTTAVYINAANSIRFERNNFYHMGGSALGLDSGAHDNEVIGNVFSDISSNGIDIDMTLTENPSDTRLEITGNVIRNNLVTQAGKQYEGSVGILAGYTAGTVIEHNEISYIPYSGINEGWGWAFASPQLQNNMVRYNNIHHVVTLLEDGAGIYTLSKQPGSFISDNYIHDIRGSPWRGFDAPVAGIYLDEGSSSITVQNNVVENVDLGLYLQSYGTTAVDNIIVNYIYDVVGNISGNIFLSDGSFFPSSVRTNSGIEPAYQDILSGRPAP
jgi:hypothetical protein